MASNLNDGRVGEVIEANTVEFTAQSYELHGPPAFGSFVQAGDAGQEIFAVTYQASTTSIEPGRRPIARGRDEPSEAAVYQNHPQLPKLLRTDFQALIVAHRADGVLRRYLPARPPRVHAFVYRSTPATVVSLTESFDFLHLIAAARVDVTVDELVAAAVRAGSIARGGDRAFLVAAGRELAVLLGGEFQRLNGVLRRIRPLE